MLTNAPWFSSSSLLAVALAFGALAACGDGASRPGVQSPAPAASASEGPSGPGPVPTAAPPGGTSGPAAPSTSGTTATSPPPVFQGPMRSPAPSAMEAKLRDIGLDPAALPPLNKLDPKTLRDVMNTFTKSLGVKCGHCHDKDFRAPTENKKITTHMWNDFTRALALEGGGALYCDSCHGGSVELLDRHDPRALGAWMQEHYVDKLKRADGKEHSCETCHGDPFEGRILGKLWR